MPSRKSQTADNSEWVLDLQQSVPNCSLGYSINNVVNWDGSVSSPQGRACEDRAFMCTYRDKRLLMVLDGHDGTKAVKFVYTYLPHLLLTSDLGGSEGKNLEVIRDAILCTEREFFIGIDPFITRKVTLQIEIEQKVPDLNSSAAMKLFPTQISEIERLDELIKGGTTMVIALTHQNKLYIANLGDSRALLCIQQPGREGSLVVKQLSVDHNTNNEDELSRLVRCGLDSNDLRVSKRLGIYQNTRSIGDYSIKGGYRNMDMLRHAKCEPGTADPHLHQPIDLSSCQGFLILMSDGLYEAYETWTERPDRVNEDLAHLVANELNICGRDGEGIAAQNVVDKVRSRYRNTCKTSRRSGRLDDITLIVSWFGGSDAAPATHPSRSLSGFPAPVDRPPYTPHPTPQPYISSHHHQPHPVHSSPYQPLPSYHQASPPHPSHHQTTLGPQTDYRMSGYDPGIGGAGNHPYSNQCVMRPGMGPERGDRYWQDARYDCDWQQQDERRGGGEWGVKSHPANKPPLKHLSTEAIPDMYKNQCVGSSAQFSPLGYPYYRRGLSCQTQGSTEFQRPPYQNQASARVELSDMSQGFLQDAYPLPRHLSHGPDAGAGQPYQDATLNRWSDFNPGPAQQQGIPPRPSQYQPGNEGTTLHQGARYEHNVDTTRTEPIYKVAQDSRDAHLSASNLASITTLPANHSTPTHISSKPAESEASRETDSQRRNEKAPPQTNSDPISDLNGRDPEPPEESVSDRYVEMETEEEPEEELDVGDMLKPYVRFNEQFPSDLSWYNIETNS